jgi:hypothetical protein
MRRVAIPLLTLAAVMATGVQAASARTNLRACFDGNCRITVSKPVSFRVSGRFGFTKVSVRSGGSGLVRVQGTAPGVSSAVVLGAGASGTINNLAVRAESIKGRKMTVRLTPVK